MNILVLGGTGAMGTPLVSILKQEKTNQIYVTSRKARTSSDNIHYLQGNARKKDFLEQILIAQDWDSVVDFMVHGHEFKDLVGLFLNNTKQYIFISSARVYSQSDEPITEQTPRLLDVSKDQKYLATNEYALAKAREEDLLYNSGKKNFTIIRPSITYNDYRLQLGVLEKENWLYRALKGRTIVFSYDIADKITTNTWGDDVAQGIASVCSMSDAQGQTFHITCNYPLTWNEVLHIYINVLEKHLNKKVSVLYTPKSTNLNFKNRIYQVIYCRYFNRRFDNTKISLFCDVSSFTPPHKGLAECLERFLQNPKFSDIDWSLEAVNDRAAKQKTPLNEIPSLNQKVLYLLYRYKLDVILGPIRLAGRVLNKIRQI